MMSTVACQMLIKTSQTMAVSRRLGRAAIGWSARHRAGVIGVGAIWQEVPLAFVQLPVRQQAGGDGRAGGLVEDEESPACPAG